MKDEYKNMSAEEMYYASIGCGCCLYGEEPEWSDIVNQLKKEMNEESN